MDGVAAVRSVLVADVALLTLVPNVGGKSQVIAGPMAIGTTLPAIGLQSISKTDLNIPSPGTHRFVTERVQVTVMAGNYRSQKDILRAVRKAAADQIYPTVAGISGVTIHTEGAGPDFMNEAGSIWLGSQDFVVRYTEER